MPPFAIAAFTAGRLATNPAAVLAIPLLPYVKCSGVRSRRTNWLGLRALMNEPKLPSSWPGKFTIKLPAAAASCAPTAMVGRVLNGPIMSLTEVGIL